MISVNSTGSTKPIFSTHNVAPVLAAVTLGDAGYVKESIELPTPLIAVAIVAALGFVAAWGILESVMLAGFLTLIGSGGLVWIIASAVHSGISFSPALFAPPPLGAGVLSGMAQQGDLPRIAGRIHPRTKTPLIATGLVVLVGAALALTFPLEPLAESTSLATLTIFAVVNLSLLRIRSQQSQSYATLVRLPLWIPIFGLVTCVLMMGTALFTP